MIGTFNTSQVKHTLMTDKYSENSGCSNHLGTCVISDPEDVAVFEANLRNPTWSDELTKDYADYIRSTRTLP